MTPQTNSAQTRTTQVSRPDRILSVVGSQARREQARDLDEATAVYLGLSIHLEHPDWDFNDPRLQLEDRYHRLLPSRVLPWNEVRDAAFEAWSRARERREHHQRLISTYLTQRNQA